MSPRIAVLDIERQSGVADGIWELRQHGWLNPGQVLERPRTICFAYKWLGEDEVFFHAEWDKGGAKGMVKKAHKVFDEATHIIGFNSKRFDTPHLRTEMIVHELPPPSPHIDIDLMLQAKKHFKFMSNRMGEIAKALDQSGKMQTGGSELWRKLRVAKGEELREARELMKAYNCQDIRATEELYSLMAPWITGINFTTYAPDLGPACPICLSTNIQYRGMSYATTYSYRRFRCNDCGKWGKDTSSIAKTTVAPL